MSEPNNKDPSTIRLDQQQQRASASVNQPIVQQIVNSIENRISQSAATPSKPVEKLTEKCVYSRYTLVFTKNQAQK